MVQAAIALGTAAYRAAQEIAAAAPSAVAPAVSVEQAHVRVVVAALPAWAAVVEAVAAVAASAVVVVAAAVVAAAAVAEGGNKS